MTQEPRSIRQSPHGDATQSGGYPPLGFQPDPPKSARSSAWERFKRWPLAGRVAAIGCTGILALFILLAVLGGILVALGFDSGEAHRQEAIEETGAEVPNLEGAVARDAQTELEELGFTVDLVSDEGSVWNPGNWVVLSTQPAAGERADEGAGITVNVTRPEEEEPATEPEDEPDTEPSEPSDEEAVAEGPDLGERLKEEALAQFFVEDFVELLGRDEYDLTLPPYYAITEIEEMNASTARVYVQEEMLDDEKNRMANWFFNMTCLEVPELETLVVVDISGVDSNHYARQFPRMPGCE